MSEKRKFELQNAESTNKPREAISLVMKLDVLRENGAETNVNELTSKVKVLAFGCKQGCEGSEGRYGQFNRR
jgi:hypothetical protein